MTTEDLELWRRNISIYFLTLDNSVFSVTSRSQSPQSSFSIQERCLDNSVFSVISRLQSPQSPFSLFGQVTWSCSPLCYLSVLLFDLRRSSFQAFRPDSYHYSPPNYIVISIYKGWCSSFFRLPFFMTDNVFLNFYDFPYQALLYS